VIDAEKLLAVTAALDGGASKAAVCRTFGIRRSTLIDSLARIGWSPGLHGRGGINDTRTTIKRSPDRRVI
jgi:transposase-like protein